VLINTEVKTMAAIGRPREFDREAALQAAMLVFWRKGFLATSMNDLCEAMAIGSPSLYAAFGSKERLYLEAVDYYAKNVRPVVWDRLAESGTARECVQNFLLASARCLPDSGTGPFSCMVTLGGLGEEAPGAVLDALKNVRHEGWQMLRSRLETAVAEGELPKSTDIDALSRFYLSVMQGIAIQARDGAKQSELEGLAEMAMAAWPA
jgi:AcrR family transcriptional regulator